MENPFQKKNLGTFPHESKAENVVEKEVAELEKMMEVNLAQVLKEHGGLESNIPLNHPYWKRR